jgi:hypothetical protein
LLLSPFCGPTVVASTTASYLLIIRRLPAARLSELAL